MNVDALPKLPPPPDSLPGFVRSEWLEAQRTSDEQYIIGPGGYNNFVDAAAAYLVTQGIKRANSPNPKAYVEDGFHMTIPLRPIIAYDEFGAQLPTTYAPPDPSLQMPVLPAWVDTPPSQPGPVFGGTHPPADPGTEADRVIAEISKLGIFLMGNFKTINAKLDDLKK